MKVSTILPSLGSAGGMTQECSLYAFPARLPLCSLCRIQLCPAASLLLPCGPTDPCPPPAGHPPQVSGCFLLACEPAWDSSHSCTLNTQQGTWHREVDPIMLVSEMGVMSVQMSSQQLSSRIVPCRCLAPLQNRKLLEGGGLVCAPLWSPGLVHAGAGTDQGVNRMKGSNE